MSFVDDMKHSIEGVIGAAEDNLEWLEKNGPIIIDALRDLWLRQYPFTDFIVDPIADRAKSELAKYIENGRSTCATFRMLVQFVGSPDELRAAADKIDAEIIVPARDLADNLVLARIPSALSSNWEDGEASEGYRVAIDGRDAAVRDVETYATPIADALREQADAIEEFYTTLRDIAISFAGLVVSVVVIAVGWETIVLGVLGIIGAIISLIALIANISDLVSTVDKTKESVSGAFTSAIPEWPAVLT